MTTANFALPSLAVLKTACTKATARRTSIAGYAQTALMISKKSLTGMSLSDIERNTRACSIGLSKLPELLDAVYRALFGG